MKPSSQANLMPLDINGTLSSSGADVAGIILSIGIVVAIIFLVTGKYWFTPYLEYRQKTLGKRNSVKSAKSKVRKVTGIVNPKDIRKD
jgi:hypothetical protein